MNGERNPVTGQYVRKGICDNCGVAVYVRGVKEPEWVHYHGSVFCMEKYAEVDGKRSPK